MSEIKVNKISPRTNCGTVTLGDSGDTFTIPSGATITNAGTASGFGATGETSWDTTVKTTGTFTATAGVGYFLNTTGGIITVNLPAGSAGDSIALADYAGTWQTSNVTVTPNGSEKIGGVNASVTLSTEGQSVTFVYIDGTQGWVNVIDSTSNVRGASFIVATGGTPCSGAICGDCKVHTFTGPGTFCVSGVATCATNNVVSYLVVAGGGGGGTNGSGGGGGAGGFRETKSPVTPYTASPLDGYATPTNRITVSASPYSIVVGGGASGGHMSKGSTSTFSTISSAGGGGGNGGTPGEMTACGSGGSGGGNRNTGSGGSGNTPPVTPPQGSNGGSGAPGPGGGANGGGGGGAVGVGTNSSSGQGGNGGPGTTTCITGSPIGKAGGGAGKSESGSAGAAGPNGGAAVCASAAANSGGGGGGGPAAGNAGSGIVIIRYKFQ